ncbi:MAG: YggS family pyridoxal phosphate-dependent enzyme [Deltaproteobacteria bacterium]|nr:YggS family pyridoxal phosphate-dependent enzyme [Deltaproteobacteria bacterium]MBF0526609.1 YggS family pyridoxal phosphate-dependent enzyme [Deltaproteobacteria bacterium]
MSYIKQNLNLVRTEMAAAAVRAGRNVEEVSLIAVTKTFGPEAVREAWAAGQQVFGENYIQEARDKIAAVGPGPIWHFIGHLQTNKAKYAVKLFDLIQTLDTPSLAQELDKRAGAAGRSLDVLIEINIALEATKAGVAATQVPRLIEAVMACPHLNLQGLMTMPPFFDDPEEARPYFAALRRMRDELVRRGAADSRNLQHLSMGMSGDYQVAIEEGATIVRVGTAIFGQRASAS